MCACVCACVCMCVVNYGVQVKFELKIFISKFWVRHFVDIPNIPKATMTFQLVLTVSHQLLY